MTPPRTIQAKKSPGEMAAHRILIVVYDGVTLLDVSGPLSIFEGATFGLRCQGLAGYECDIVSMKGGLISTDLGAQIMSKMARNAAKRPFDTLVIPGARDLSPALDKKFIAWITKHGRHVRRLCSVCGGASPLAASGLADGRRLATHWINCDALQKLRPAVKVEPDPIYIQDGHIWSSAGVTAGIDMALALIEQDHGRDLAMAVARAHNVYLRRPGDQSQFSTLLEAQISGKQTFVKLHEWLLERIGDSTLGVDQLAECMGMSVRNFSRVYTATTGHTPGKTLELFRVEAARRLLESTEHPVDYVAQRTGFGNSERMRTSFQRCLKISPTDYRERFGR